MQDTILSNESYQLFPLNKPFLSNSELEFRENLKIVSRLLKIQNKQLLYMRFFFEADHEALNKALLKLCDQYPRNLHWLKRLIFQEGSSTKLAIKNLVRLRKCLQNTAQSLTFLVISGSTLNHMLALAPFLKDLKKLEYISLDLRHFTTNHFRPKLFSSLKTLKRLKDIRIYVDPQERLSVGTLNQVCTGLSSLKTLNSIDLDVIGSQLSVKQDFVFGFRTLKWLALRLGRIEEIDDKFMENIAKCLKQVQKLEKFEIDLFDCPQITNKGIEILSSSLPPDLTALRFNISHCKQVNEKGVQILLLTIRKMTFLKHLTLWFSSRSEMGNGGLLDLNLCLSGLKNLKSLEISFMDVNSDFGIDELVFDEFLCVLGSKSALKNLLLVFSSRGIHMVDDKRFERLGDALTNLKGIEDLELNFFGKGFDDATLERFSDKLKSFEKLQSLYLDFSHSWRDYKVKTLVKLIQGLQTLKDLRKATLDFEYCALPSPEEIEKILPNPQTIEFELSFCY